MWRFQAQLESPAFATLDDLIGAVPRRANAWRYLGLLRLKDETPVAADGRRFIFGILLSEFWKRCDVTLHPVLFTVTVCRPALIQQYLCAPDREQYAKNRHRVHGAKAPRQ
jgi:hypothetical protein